MNSEFGDWPEEEYADGFAGDDAETADLGGLGGDDPPALEGFGPADAEQGFGVADEGPLDELPAGETPVGGTGGALGYGDDLSGPADAVDDAVDDGSIEAGFGAAPAAEQGFGAADPPPGVDPDVPAGADEWPAAVFPPLLDSSGLPTPVDGWPWADPDLLGSDATADAAEPDQPAGSVDPTELAGYAGVDDSTAGLWATLLSSDDPATATLARFWTPGPR